MDTSNHSALPTPASRAPSGGGSSAPAARRGFFARAAGIARESTWAPVIVKSTAVFAGMVALAAIGVVSSLSPGGVPVAGAAPAVSTSTTSTLATPPLAASPPAPSASASTASAAPASSPGLTADGKIILNQATAEDLQKLPRIGAKRAQAILEMRHRLGKFRQPTDLLRVKGIGRKSLRLMLPLLVVDAPVTP